MSSSSSLQPCSKKEGLCHVYICTLHACPEPQWAYRVPALRPLLLLWWELNCSGWEQLGAITRERERVKGFVWSSVCACMCVCVWDWETRPDQCQHVELIRLVITPWKRDTQREKEDKMRQGKQVEEDPEVDDERGGGKYGHKENQFDTLTHTKPMLFVTFP